MRILRYSSQWSFIHKVSCIVRTLVLHKFILHCWNFRQLLDDVFVISKIIKVEVETLIIMDITKTKCKMYVFKVCVNSFFSSGSLSFFLFHLIGKQLLTPLRRLFVFCVSLSSTIFSMTCLVNEANLEVMFLLRHWRQATQSARTWYDHS